MLSESTQPSSNAWPPRIANTAENNAEPTNSQHTMAVVLAVRNTASLVRFQSSVRAWNARMKAPAAPTAADSVAVVIPNRMTARTITVRMPSGITDEVKSLSTSKRTRARRRKEGAARHHGRGQELEHLEALAGHAPIGARGPQHQYGRSQKEPEIELEVRKLFGWR